MSEVSFVDEIQDMLWAFGDVGRGQLATAQLVEKVLTQQLSWFWSAVVDAAAEHGAPAPALEHFLFVMRKAPTRNLRVLRYLLRRSIATSATNPFTEDPLDAPRKCQKYRRCVDYLELLDPMFVETEDITLDETEYRRMLRADQVSRFEDSSKYQEYTKARRVSFGHGRSAANKFSEYMNRFDLQRLRTAETVDLTAFLAYEMVGELVDLALLARRDRDPRPISPADVREVLRRLQSTQGLPGGLFVRLPAEGRDPPLLGL